MAARDTEGPVTERQSIIEAYWRASAENVRAALATVVRVEGSAYRRPGARMVITETGRTSGVVSGGCLEGDVQERAVRVMRTGNSTLVKYDTTADDETVWGLGLGCNGIVHVLIEPASDHTDHLVRFLDACSKGQDRAAFATVIRSEGVAEVALGTRLFLYPDGISESDADLPERIMQQILTDLHAAVRSGVSSVTHFGADAAVEIFIEVVEPQVPLVIFGAGADAVPLVEMARQLGWHTTVVDTHARSRSLERFANADAVILCRPEEVGACRGPLFGDSHRVPSSRCLIIVRRRAAAIAVWGVSDDGAEACWHRDSRCWRITADGASETVAGALRTDSGSSFSGDRCRVHVSPDSGGDRSTRGAGQT